MGAASGLFAVLLLAAALIIFISTDPGGGNTPRLPNIDQVEAAPAFIADHLNAIRAQVMLNGIAMMLFLWFLGTLWGVLRSSEAAEGEPARGSAIAFAGALTGVGLTLLGLVLLGAATLTTTDAQAEVVPTLYTAATVALAFGGGAFAVFYLGVAEVVLRTGAMAKWIGWLAVLAALVSVFGFVTPYARDGVFNAATGAIGFYGHYIAFVVFLFCSSLTLALAQHRNGKASAASPRAAPETGAPGGAT